ncbi:hypothetical protein M9434_000750 [Picochlorum sp. BPE23]|nr:hypothetical protein M9434_000750 [Picochlorum sp. BPE23]
MMRKKRHPFEEEKALTWESVSWPDGSRYEGLVKGDCAHVRGVFTYGKDGDTYVGEYKDNEMDGYGVYAWKRGTVYRGEWKESMMHGCGVKVVKQANGTTLAEEGEFVEDEWKGVTGVCSLKQARKAAEYADVAAQMASAFQLDREYVADDGNVPAGLKRVAEGMEANRSERRKGRRFFGLF